MKRIALALLAAALPIAASACDEARSEAPAADAPVQSAASVSAEPAGPLQPIALRVPDMSCGLCARPIEKNLQAMGVRDVKADLETKWVTGRFDPERITPEAIRTKVEELKFRVTEVRVR
jgi:copper chaperone CopZ